MFKVTSEEVQAFRKEHDLGLLQAKEKLIKLKMIEHLENGGTAEPVLLYLLKEWNKDVQTKVSDKSEGS